ncbi:MAG: sigma 54-interacting transcriptional regulator [Gammaproteobacteria bacterium]|nr:sigma 54-interacting transcriptional regulator [Gammaproteobacteria bacterium]
MAARCRQRTATVGPGSARAARSDAGGFPDARTALSRGPAAPATRRVELVGAGARHHARAARRRDAAAGRASPGRPAGGLQPVAPQRAAAAHGTAQEPCRAGGAARAEASRGAGAGGEDPLAHDPRGQHAPAARRAGRAAVNAPRGRILLVDDDPSLMRLLVLRLEAEGFEVVTAASGTEALQRLRGRPVELMISDLRMEGMDGIELFEHVQHYYPGLPVIIITAQGSIPDAVAATQKGVFGFLTKPIEREQLKSLIERALSVSAASRPPATQGGWRDHVQSRSQVMERLLQTAQQVASSNISVLISGGSGSGKELLALAIHRSSARCDGPFIPLNCGALPEALLESELFGHVKGAFTGAVSDHVGLFRAAEGGTLFLDEIGDMPLALQVKLLRVLQEKEVRPVGSTRSFGIDVRVLSATHRDLEQAMKEGSFRQDLYYRLNVVNLRVPDLRERPEDIALLASHFLRRFAEETGQRSRTLSPEALEVLAGAAWPGNVRQLENVVHQTLALTRSPVISAAQIREALAEEAGYLPSFNEARHQFERDYLVKVLRMAGGNVAQAARIAQRNRTDLYKLLQRHELRPERFKSEE